MLEIGLDLIRSARTKTAGNGNYGARSDLLGEFQAVV